MEETRNKWFVYSTYTPAGRPIMEDRLMEMAKKLLLYRIIDFADFGNAVKELNRQQDIIYEQNKRLKKVKVAFTFLGHDMALLCIGEQNLSLRKVRGKY